MESDDSPERNASRLPEACREEPSESLLEGIRQFNAGEFYACHETLEILWLGETGQLRDFFQGLLQIAVACHHWQRGNLGGAESLLKKGTARLSPLGPVCRQVDVEGLLTAVEVLRRNLRAVGDDRTLRRPVEFPHIALARPGDLSPG